MNLNKYTQKAQEGVLGAQRLAEEMNHAQIEPEHLLVTLSEQPEGIVPAVLRKLEVDPAAIARQIRSELGRAPQAYGGSQPALSPRVRTVADKAQAEADRLKDEFVSTEHLLLAILSEAPRSSAAVRVLQQHGITKDNVLEALTSIRGNQQIGRAHV